jgi:hypothetical protein
MSQLSKSLEKRIQELTASIESQKIEIAAYERVLQMELSKEDAPAETVTVAPEITLAVADPKKAPVAEIKPKAPVTKVAEVAYAGNKTALVADIVKSFGSAGATPKDVDAFFTAKKIARSSNLVYNTLSYLVAHGKLARSDGRYFLAGGAPAPAKKTAPAKKKSAVAKKTGAPTKRRLSPEGLKRIKEALKKRWADKKAADAAAAKKK